MDTPSVHWRSLLDIAPSLVVHLILPFVDASSYVALVGTCRSIRRDHVCNTRLMHNSELPFVRCMEALDKGHNVFLNAPAGRGKSFLLNRVKEAVERRLHRRIQLTAPTGLAASALLDGCTIHSASGLGQGTIPLDKLRIKLDEDLTGALFKKWREYDIIAVDEVGMLGATFFQKCDMAAQHARGNSRILGGTQLIIAGDFLQLAPVGDTLFATSPMWDPFNFVIIDMETPHRQMGDQSYDALLQRVRVGEYTPADIAVLNARLKLTHDIDWDKELIRPTHLYAHAKDVQERNQREFQSLVEPEGDMIFPEDIAAAEAEAAAAAQAAAEVVEVDGAGPHNHLNVGYHPTGGADVAMMLDDHGNMPVVVAAAAAAAVPEEVEVDWDAEDEVCEYISTVDPVTKRSKKQLRVTTRVSLQTALVKMGSKLDQKVPRLLQFKKSAQYILTFNYDLKQNKSNGSPCVYTGRNRMRFLDGSVLERESMFTTVIMPVPNEVNIYIRRRQLGLRLGYASTMHGVQGATLERALINLGPKVFASNSSYVCLSRLKNLNSLFLSDFNEKSLRVSKVAKKFYDDLARQRARRGDDPTFQYIPPPYDAKASRKTSSMFGFLFCGNSDTAQPAAAAAASNQTSKKSRGKKRQGSSPTAAAAAAAAATSTSADDPTVSDYYSIVAAAAAAAGIEPPTATVAKKRKKTQEDKASGSGSSNDPFCLF